MASSIHEQDENQLTQGVVLGSLGRTRVGVSSRGTDIAKRRDALINDRGHRNGRRRHDVLRLNHADRKDPANHPAYIARELALDLGEHKEIRTTEELARCCHDTINCRMASKPHEGCRAPEI